PDLPVESSAPVLTATTARVAGLHFDRGQLTETALANRMEMMELELQLAADSIVIDVQRNQIRPQLDFQMNTQLLGAGRTHAQAKDQAWDGDYSDWFAGLTLDVPLAGNQSARALHRQAELSFVRTRILRERQQVAVRKQVNDAVDLFEQSLLRILASEHAAKAAERDRAATEALLRGGQATVDDVLRSSNRLAAARIQAVRAIVDYQLARVDLAVATGTMLGYGRVQWNPTQVARTRPRPEWGKNTGWKHQAPRPR
ncbi:MAG: TolC family protein, partial [Planctomycetales bacterium]